MKRTLGLFATAFAMFVVAIALPERAEPEQLTLALDADGVREVRIAGGTAQVYVSSAPAQASWSSYGQGDVTARREGDVLHVDLPPDLHAELRLPADLALLVVEGGVVDSMAADADLRVRTTGALQFSGEAARLVIDADGTGPCVDPYAAHAVPSGDSPDYCTDEVRVSGDIGELVIMSNGAHVVLVEPQDMGRVTLRLGADISFSLENADTLDNVRIERIEADAPAPATPPEDAALP